MRFTLNGSPLEESGEDICWLTNFNEQLVPSGFKQKSILSQK